MFEAWQRIRQGVRALLAFTQAVDYDLAVVYLNDKQMGLFDQLGRSEQLHSLNVLRTVLKQGDTPPDLAIAALLHDAGKACYPLAVWQKTLVVLVRAFLPHLYSRWGQGDPYIFWRRPFIVAQMHPVWSAEMVAATGASECALWLIAHHADKLSSWNEDHPYTSLLARLQLADDAN